MSIKASVATMLKAIRKAHGLSQRDLAEVSSRIYVSKLQRGQSSPTLEMMATLSAPLGLSPLTLVAVTIGAETSQPIRSLIRRMEKEIDELTKASVLQELEIPAMESPPANRFKPSPRNANPALAAQTEF
jgi:transcriptional regulator with XRE-family HTH domain